MVDIPLIPPSSSGTPRVSALAAGPISIGQQGGQQLILSNIAAGTILTGNVTGNDAKGNIILETNAVRLVLQSAVQLPKNSQVTLRVEPTLSNDAMPAVRILTVDGKSFSQVAQQQNQLAQQMQNPQASQGGQQLQPYPQTAAGREGVVSPETAKAAELAKPIAQLLEISARASGQIEKVGAETLQQTSTMMTPRSVAAQLNISAVQTLPAVLLRPLVTAKTLELLNSITPQLPALATGKSSAEAPMQPLPQPALTTAMLRPGLQLQVRLLDMPPVPQIAAAASAGRGVAPAIPSAPPMTTSATPPVAPLAVSPSPIAITPEALIPLTIASKAAYAAYAKQPAATMTPPLPQQSATPQPTPQPASSNVTQQPPLPPSPAVTPQQPTTPSPAASAPLSQPVIQQLLTQAEGKGLPQGQMAAVVIGKDPSGIMTVQTRIGLFTLPATQGEALQPGSVITWQVKQVMPQLLPLAEAGGSALAQALRIGREGSALHELAFLLQGMQGATTNSTMQRIIPHTGPQLTAGMILFMSVIRRGDVQAWLGKDLSDQIEAMGKGDLLQRLGGELGALRSLFGGGSGDTAAQPTNQWQGMFIPVMVNKELETAQLFVKRDGSGKKGSEGGTRFLVELNLSAFGPMQMDGLVSKREAKTHFNLAIRTLAELPEEVKSHIFGIFDTAQQATGMAGGLSFRTMHEFPVNPLDEIHAEQDGDNGSILA